MSETKQPTADKQEAYQAFIEHYNLSPLNNDAIMNCLFEQHQEIQKLKQVNMLHKYFYGTSISVEDEWMTLEQMENMKESMTWVHPWNWPL